MRALHLSCMIKILTVMHTLTTTPYTLSSQSPFLCVGYNISINMLVPNFIIRNSKFQYNKCFELSSLPGITNELVYMNECVITIIQSGMYTQYIINGRI